MHQSQVLFISILQSFCFGSALLVVELDYYSCRLMVFRVFAVIILRMVPQSSLENGRKKNIIIVYTIHRTTAQ